MSKLRKSVVDQIYNAIENTYFGLDNFDLAFPKDGSPLVQISFIPQPSYSFSILDDYNDDGKVATSESPGEFKVSDNCDEIAIGAAIYRIEKWSKRIRQELSSVGIKNKENNELFEKIDEYVKTLNEPDEGFESSEIEVLKSQLADLQAKFEELSAKSIITEKELNKLKDQIVGAENDLNSYSKDIWYKTSMRKIVGTTKAILTSKEGKDVALALVKKMIGM